MKIVINACHGGFGLSDKAIEYYGELKNLGLVKQEGKYFNVSGYDWYVGEINDDNYFSDRSIPRDDPDLVRVVEELGTETNTRYSELKIVEIPDDVEWDIEEYDGAEWVAEKHRTWS
jgi:hypothetical protein